MKRLWCSIVLVILLLCVSSNAGAMAITQPGSTTELCLQQGNANKATLPDVLQVAYHLPAAHRSSSFIVNNLEPAWLHQTDKPVFRLHTAAHITQVVSAMPLHLAIRVLLI